MLNLQTIIVVVVHIHSFLFSHSFFLFLFLFFIFYFSDQTMLLIFDRRCEKRTLLFVEQFVILLVVLVDS